MKMKLRRQCLNAARIGLQVQMFFPWLIFRVVGIQSKKMWRKFWWLLWQRVINKITNATFICQIPRKKNSIKITDFRPTSLVTSLYKIIAKVLSLRLKEVPSKTISSSQSAFVNGHQIFSAVLVANEVVEDCKKKKKEGMVIRINFEKEYDHIDWNLLILFFKKKGEGNG